MAEDPAGEAVASVRDEAGLSPSAPAGVNSKQPRHIFYWLVAAPLAVALVWWSLRGIEWRRVAGILSSVRWSLAGLTCAIGTGSYFVRSLRWRVLLGARQAMPRMQIFWATMAGYLGNNLLPARAGEVVRSILVSRWSTLSTTYVLTTAFTERLTDAVVLVVLSRILLADMKEAPAWLDAASTSACVIGLAALGLVLIIRRWSGAVPEAAAAMPIPEAWRVRARGIAEQVALGFAALDDTSRLTRFCGLTALIWTADTANSIILARALGLHLDVAVAVLLITGLGLGSALPSVPGYIGIYQFVAVTVLVPFGFGRDEALAYIVAAQAANYLVILFWGGIGLGRMGARDRSDRAQAAATTLKPV